MAISGDGKRAGHMLVMASGLKMLQNAVHDKAQEDLSAAARNTTSDTSAIHATNSNDLTSFELSTRHKNEIKGVAALRLLQGLCASQIATSQHLATALDAAVTPHETAAMAKTFYAKLARTGNAGAGFVGQFGRDWLAEALLIWENLCEGGRVLGAQQGMCACF
jgi:hypothetical protein